MATLRSIISNADGRRAEYLDEGKIKFKQYPIGASDKDILADFAVGRSPRGRDGKAPVKGDSAELPDTGTESKQTDVQAAKQSDKAEKPDDSKATAKGKDGKTPDKGADTF